MRIIIFYILVFVTSSTVAQTNLLYGPYLQSASPNSAFVCWRTNTVTNSKVNFGTIKTNLNQSVSYFANITQHQIQLTALIPNTKYYYTVGTTAQKILPDTFYFYTAPVTGSKQKIKVLAMGDCGTAQPEQTMVRDAVKYFLNQNYINCLLLLGDNAYNSGLDNEFTANFFTPYQNQFIFPYSCIYPTLGNHDYANSFVAQTNHNIAYHSIFVTPQNGELGGVPSNNNAFYSYNYANIHFISLDSYGIESGNRFYDTLGPQYVWLKQDLIANTQLWTIVYFHHPPYTMGSHNSDSEGELVYTRQKVAPLLDRYGVDLVLTGHSHNYERSWMLNGHYGMEATFNKNLHTIDSSSGEYDGSQNSCAYFKKTRGKGTVYAVAGAAGVSKGGQASFPHNAMYFSEQNKSGAFYFEVYDNRLDTKYIGGDSIVHDKFTIFKNVNKTNLLYMNNNQDYTIAASWPGNYNWLGQSNFSQTISGTTTTNTLFVVRDSLNCLTDTFKIFPGTGITEINNTNEYSVYPNPGADGIKIKINSSDLVKNLKIIDGAGRFVKSSFQIVNENIIINTTDLPSGAYVLKIETDKAIRNYKIIITK